jgi:CheY-like chemotaxis protein/anti-sigma regulatory factor (Ser/Thr protein kinase)
MSARLLIVDDEPLNLEILSEYFDGLNYHLTTASSGEAAWGILQEDHSFDLILLDRMMPGLDGVELLKRIKAAPRLASIPVIMQTAASAPEQVREGLMAGALYYLTKPYEQASLIAIVRAALADTRSRRDLQQRLQDHVSALRLMQDAHFSFATLEEASRLALFLAHACPAPESAVLGLSELMINAVEHGNLGISYGEKSRLKRSDQWEQEVERRLALPENRQKLVEVNFSRNKGLIRIRIRDQGNGFDWRPYLDFDPQRVFDPNGRGIAMARLTCFDSLDYLDNGNTVVATLHAPETRS